METSYCEAMEDDSVVKVLFPEVSTETCVPNAPAKASKKTNYSETMDDDSVVKVLFPEEKTDDIDKESSEDTFSDMIKIVKSQEYVSPPKKSSKKSSKKSKKRGNTDEEKELLKSLFDF